MSEKKIGIGMIGTGGWARYGHIPVIKYLDEFELTAVFNRNEEKAEKYKETLGFKKAYSQLDDMLHDDDIDLVLVLTPGNTHASYSRKVIEAGKDVYTEWPLSTSTAESEELLKLSQEKGVHTVIGMQRRLAPSARYMQDLIQCKDYIGDMLSVDLRVGIDAFGNEVPEVVKWFTAPDSFTNPITIYAAHFSNLLFSITGAPEKIAGMTKKNFEYFTIPETGEKIKNVHPTEMVSMGKLDNGALFTFNLEGGQKHITGVDLQITGTKGVLKMTNVRGFQNKDDNTITGFHEYEEDFHDLPIPDSYRYFKDSHLDNSVQDLGYLYRAYASDKLKGTHFSSTYTDAVNAHKFIDAIMNTSKGF